MISRRRASIGLVLLFRIVFLLVVRATVAMGSKDAFILLSSDLLTSSSRASYSSDQGFIDAHNSYLTKILDPASAHHGKAHDFVLNLKPRCSERCHETLLRTFSPDRYRILSADKAIVFATVDQLEAMIMSENRNTDNKEQVDDAMTMIQYYAPILPTMKIDSSVRQMSKEGNGCAVAVTSKDIARAARKLNPSSTSSGHQHPVSSPKEKSSKKSPSPKEQEQEGVERLERQPHTTQIQTQAHSIYPSKKLLVVITALTPSELRELSHELDALSKDTSASFSLPHLMIDLVSGKKSKTIVVIPDCRHTDIVARKLSHLREVIWIEQYIDPVLHNRWAKGVCQSGDYTSTPIFSANLTGTGEIIGVTDTGLDITSCYFFDPNNEVTYNSVNNNHRKVVSYMYNPSYGDKTDDAEGHGTHVSGIAVGRSFKDWGDYLAFRGHAYEAKVAFYDVSKGAGIITVPTDISSIFNAQYAAGARVMSNSWGVSYSSSGSSNKYTSNAIEVDEFMWKYNDSLILFASGNNGDDGLNTVVAPATCKSCVTVGASLNAHMSFNAYTGGPDSRLDVGNMGSFSARGPTYDGRLKPDVLAPGWWIASAASTSSASFTAYNSSSIKKSDTHCDLRVLEGTSMSTPAVAASAALIRQYFREGYYPSGSSSSNSKNDGDAFIPSGALLKAMLVHSGQPVDYIVQGDSTGNTVAAVRAVSSYPDNNQGYGRMQVDKVLSFDAATMHPISLFVVGAADPSHPLYRSLRTGEKDSYYFTTPSDPSQLPSEIVVTLTYTDYPGTHGSKYLINDLDVVLIDGLTMMKYFPLSYYTDTASPSPVEKIILDSPRVNATYTVQVYANGTLSHVQPYALVITGTITNYNQTTAAASIIVSGTMTNKLELDSIGATIVTALSIAGFFLVVVVLWIYWGNRRVPLSRLDDKEGAGGDDEDDAIVVDKAVAAGNKQSPQQQQQQRHRSRSNSNRARSSPKGAAGAADDLNV